MEIIYEMTGDTLTAQLMGELDHHAAAKVRGDIDDTMDRYGAMNLIFDFSRVTFMDSAGIGVVLGRYKRLQTGGESDAKCSGVRARGLSAGGEDDDGSVGGRVVITGCSQKIHTILHMAGIFSLMKYTETKEEAVAYLHRNEVQ